MELLGLERGDVGRQVQIQEWADVEAHPWHMPKFWKRPRFPHLLPFSLGLSFVIIPLVGYLRHAFSQELTGLGRRQHQVARLEVRVSRADAKSCGWKPRETKWYQKSGTTWSSYVALYPQQAGGKESGRHQPWEWEGESPEGQITSQSSASLLEGLRRYGGLFLAQGCEHPW